MVFYNSIVRFESSWYAIILEFRSSWHVPKFQMKDDALIVQDQVRELNRRAVTAFLQQNESVEELCQRALSLAVPDGYENPADAAGAAEALRTLGRFHMARSDHGKALDYFHHSLRLFEMSGLTREIVQTRSYLGVVFIGIGDYSRAAELLRHSLQEAEAIPDPLLSAEILNDLSYDYVLAGEPELALKHLHRAIQVFRDLHEDLHLCWALESLGQAYLLVGRKQEALDCVLESVALAEKMQDQMDTVRMKQSAGEMYRAAGDPQSALKVFQEVLDLSRRSSMRGEECSALFSIADIYQAEGRSTEALPLLQEAVSIAGQTGAKSHLRQCCLLLSGVYKRLGDYPHALEYHERFFEVDKEIFNAENDQRLRNVQALYQLETARKEAELYQLRAQALQQEVEDRKRTEAILEYAARHDPLTDLFNRRAFFDMAELIFAATRAGDRNLSAILIDVDHFKDVNDSFGHQVGDAALAMVAERLRSHLRAGDKIARYGGEEFIILLEGISPSGALHMADRLRQAVGNEPLKVRGISVPVTISLGVAGTEPGKQLESLDQLISHADQALYAAKNCGRNAAFSFDAIAAAFDH